MVKYTLYYFDARARAETIRMVLAAGGVPFEDKRLDFEKAWPAFKPKTPTGMLPVLEVDGQMIPESMAISRFVARETGLGGKTSLDQARIDAAVDILTEVREAAFPAFFEKDKDKKEALKKTLEEKAAKNLKLIDAKLNHNKNGKSFLQGDSVTLADIHFLTVIDPVRKVLPDVLKPFPALQGLETRISALPKIAAYLKKRPDNNM